MYLAVDQSKFEVNTCSGSEARENEYEAVTIGFDFTSDWIRQFSIECRKIKTNWNQLLTNKTTQPISNQRNCLITSTLDWKPL